MLRKTWIWVLFLWFGPPLGIIVVSAARVEGTPAMPGITDWLLIAAAVAWILCAFVSLVSSIRFAIRRNWYATALTLALPSFAIVQACLGFPVVNQVSDIGDAIYFARIKPIYDRQIATLPRPRFQEFDWDGIPDAWDGIIYDETDQIALPGNRRSKDWIARVIGKNDPYALYRMCTVRPLWSHYYRVTFNVFCSPSTSR